LLVNMKGNVNLDRTFIGERQLMITVILNDAFTMILSIGLMIQ